MWPLCPNLRHCGILISLDSAKSGIGFFGGARAQKKLTRINVLEAKTGTCAARRLRAAWRSRQEAGFERPSSFLQSLKNDEWHQHFAGSRPVFSPVKRGTVCTVSEAAFYNPCCVRWRRCVRSLHFSTRCADVSKRYTAVAFSRFETMLICVRKRVMFQHHSILRMLVRTTFG